MSRTLKLKLVVLALACMTLAGACNPSTPVSGVERTDPPIYKLGAGDQLNVTVFRHEDLSGPVQVDGRGNIVLPLAGEISAKGLSVRELEAEIENKLKEGYLVDPQVSIEVQSFRDYYMIGEINGPGNYEYKDGITVLEAIITAGGFTYRGDKDDIIIYRGGSGGPQEQAFADTPVFPGDIIEVRERYF